MPRIGATERLARVLTYVPWIASHDGPSIDEVCERFGVKEKDLLADLAILPFIGIPPYTPDTLIEVTVEDGRVWIHYADFFAKPLRLTPEEGLALVAAGAALREVPGQDSEGALERGLRKLADVLGVDPNMVDTGPADPGMLDVLRRSAEARRSVDLTYYSYGRDERTQRLVDPWRVYHERGSWYLVGHCHLADGERLFRLDRIEAIVETDARFDPPPPTSAMGSFAANPDDPRVTIEVGSDGRWIVDHYPVEEVDELDDSRLRVRLAVAGGPWLERMLLRLGPTARIVDSDDPALADAGRRAAERMLARYRA